MTDSILEEIERGWQLLNEGRERDALNLIIEIEKEKNLKPTPKLRCQILKGLIFFLLGKFEEALEIGRQTFKESINLKKPLLSIDATYVKWGALYLMERATETWEDIKYCEELINSPLHGTDSEIEQAKALFFYMRGYYHYWQGEYDGALEYHEKSLEIFSKHNRYGFLKPHVLMVIGHSYGIKGELDKALEYHKKSLECIKGNVAANMLVNAGSFNSMGTIYYQKGNLDQAIEHFEKSLQIFEKLNVAIYVGRVYDNLINISLDKNDSELACEYLNRFEQYNKNVESRGNDYYFMLSQARILKSSTRTRDWTEAEKILIDLLREYKMLGKEFTPGLIILCDFYFQELKLTNDLKILEDIRPLIERLIKEAERRNSYSLRARAFLLKGKMSLLQLNMGDARRYLAKAQQIADSHDLQLLARAISHEHDKILEQLGELEEYKKKKMTISERMTFASLDETLELMHGKRAINAPELIDEQPVLLLILATGGILIFSHSFADEWRFDSELFGGFLSAFNSISAEIFSEGLDRVKFGQHTVLMESVANFSICYLYKGQTYIAKQKLANFTEQIKSTTIWKTLENYYKTSQVIQLKDNPSLELLITEIFA